MRKGAFRGQMAQVQLTACIHVTDEQRHSHLPRPGHDDPSPCGRMRDGAEERRCQDSSLRASLVGYSLLDRVPHATEWREVQFVVERRRRQMLASVPSLCNCCRAVPAEEEVSLHEHAGRDVGSAARVGPESIRRWMLHDELDRRNVVRKVRSAACTRDFTVPRGRPRARAVSANVRPRW